MEQFNPLPGSTVTTHWAGSESRDVDGFARRFQSAIDSSPALARRGPEAFAILLMGAVLSWQGRWAKRIFVSKSANRVEVFKLSWDKRLSGFFYGLTPDAVKPASRTWNMNRLANFIVRETGRSIDEARDMIREQFRSWKYITFDNNGDIKHEQLSLVPIWNGADDPNIRSMDFESLKQILDIAELNPLFGMKVEKSSESLAYFQKFLNEYFAYFRSIPSSNHQDENFLDFVHGILLNVKEEMSLRIYRPNEHGDIAIGSEDPLLEHFSPVIYLHQHLEGVPEPTTFSVPPEWNFFTDRCIYLKLQPGPGALDMTLSRLKAAKPANSESYSPLKRFQPLTLEKNVYWPEAILAELAVRRNFHSPLSKRFFKPNHRLDGRRFSLDYGILEDKKVLVNVIEYDRAAKWSPQRKPVIVPQFAVDEKYVVFELHVLSPEAAREVNAAKQLLDYKFKGPAENYIPVDGEVIHFPSVDSELIRAKLFVDPMQAIPSIENAVKQRMPNNFWNVDRMSSVLRGALSSDIGLSYNTFLDNSVIHVFKAGFVEGGVIFKFSDKRYSKDYEIQFNSLRNRLMNHIDNLRLREFITIPEIFLLRTYNSRDNPTVVFKPCPSKRNKRAEICDYVETKDESFEERLLEEERFVEKFKSYEKLRYPYQKEHFRKASSSRNFERATKWSNALMNLLVGKDILASMIKGDWSGVVFNTGFLVGGAALSTYGAKLTAMGKMYRSVGRRALGNAMLVGGPILSRLPSVFILFDFFKQWHNFQKGDEGAIVGVVADGVAIANEATAVLVEVLSEFGVGLSWPAAPIGALIFLGVDIYNSIRAVGRINEKVHLSKGEKFGEFFLAFMGLGPTPYMQHLLDEKNMNDRNMDDLSQRFTCSKDVAFYAQPSQWVKDTCKQKCVAPMIFYPSVSEICGERTCEYTVHNSLNNMADFRAKVNMFSRVFPKTVNNLELQCSNATANRETDEDESRYLFKCTNMMSVKIENATTQTSFIEIGSGNDIIYSYEEVTNVIRMRDGQKNVIGGNKPDMFILYGDQPIVGTIDGSNGVDELNLQSHEIKASLIVKPVESSMDLQMTRDVDGSSSEALYLKNIEKIVGRSGQQDVVHVGCILQDIDLKGGSSGREDKIIIDGNVQCPETLTMLIEGPFNIENRAKSGKFNYIVRSGHQQQAIHLATDENVLNWIAFNYSLADVSEILHVHRGNTAEDETIQKRLLEFKFFHSDGVVEPQTWISFASDNTNMQFLFTDNVTLVHKGSTLVGYKEVLEGQVDDLIRKYRPVANSQHLHLVFDIRNKMKVFMGHGTYKNITLQQHLNNETSTNAPTNVMTNDFAFESHLVSGTTENLFLIRANIPEATQSFSCSMEPTIIHYSPGMKNSTIDLSDLALKHMSSSAKLSLKLMFSSSEDDTTLILGTLHNSTGRENLFGTITLKNFSSDVLKTLITVKTDDNVFWIDTETRSFKSKPVHFDEKTEVIILRPEDNIDHLIISDQIDESTFIKCNESLTMMYDVAEGPSKKTITLLSYFNSTTVQREKFNAMQFEFKNRSFVLSDELHRSMNFYNMC